METNIGQLNIIWGWVWMVLGITSGAILGMYAFGGPLPPPKTHTNYDDLPRRLVRLAHIAFFMLPLISIVYGMHIDQTMLSVEMKTLGSYSFIVCMIGVPTLLIAASFKNIIKYLEIIPVSAGFVALILMAWGKIQYIN